MKYRSRKKVTTLVKFIAENASFIIGRNLVKQHYLPYKLIISDSEKHITKVHTL